MSLSTTKLLLTITLIIWVMTILMSITIMISGKKIFIKATKGEKTYLYPIINLFSMLEIADISTYYGILFFVPIANLFILIVMSYKLGNAFNAGFGFKLGLVLFPILFYYLLGNGNKQYKLRDEDYFKALDNIRDDHSESLIQEETPSLEESIQDSNVSVDSIFKSKAQVMEEVLPYKAAKIDLIGMEKLKGNEEETQEDKKN